MVRPIPLRILPLLLVWPASAQVDQSRAAAYFKEASAACEREGAKLWGVSLCGPMVFADAATHTIATSQTAPLARQPAALGFANAALEWGGVHWSTFVWRTIPADPKARGRLFMHELFHRIQPQLAFNVRDGNNEHLDTLEGRYWLQLEWRALGRGLASSGAGRTAAVADALALRAARRRAFPAAAENEQLEEIREGLAQYTGTVVSTHSLDEAAADAIKQLEEYPSNPTLVRTFAYPSGTAYGLLLDTWSPGWTRKLKPSDDLGQLLMTAAGVEPAADADRAASRYGGPALRLVEEQREREHRLRVMELRRRFVEGPVLILPNAGGSFVSLGVTPIPGIGTVYPSVRVTAEWGSLAAAQALRPADRKTLVLPAPASADGAALTGDGWTLQIAPGWMVRRGGRAGDYELVRSAVAR